MVLKGTVQVESPKQSLPKVTSIAVVCRCHSLTLQKYSLGFFYDWCFVTIPSCLVKDPSDEEYKKIYIQFDCFFSIRTKTQFILITGIKSREKLALSQEVKNPGNEVNVHIFNFLLLRHFISFIWMSLIHSTFSF